MILKKQELKNIIKPMVEEAVKDVLLKGGLLSAIISEVVSGIGSGQQIMESKPSAAKPQQSQVNEEAQQQQTAESRKKLLDAIGTSGYNGVNVFEGTQALKKGGTPNQSSGGYSPFEGVDPGDPGVDISALTSRVGNAWKKLS